MPPGYRKASDLPQVIPVFPLDGALLLPGGHLPLNVFEPRYLNMFDDAMAGDRIIGMIQTQPGGDATRPSLVTVGCAGRVTSFSETPDGRYLVTLTGLCRFQVRDELPVRSPYRQVRALFGPYEEDLDAGEAELPRRERETFLLALRHYLDHRGLDIDWASAESAPTAALVNSLSMALPFEPAEKQALLETQTVSDRCAALVALLEFDAADDSDDAPPYLQ
jgi:Lon protease-like protein